MKQIRPADQLNQVQLKRLAQQAEQSTLMIVSMVDEKLVASSAILAGLDAKDAQMSAADKERWYFAREHYEKLQHWRHQLMQIVTICNGYPEQYRVGHVMGAMESRVPILDQIGAGIAAHDNQLRSIIGDHVQ